VTLRELGAEFAGVVLTRVDVAKHAKYGYHDRAGYYKYHQKYYLN
jgi:succinoglycan biosynthesis transport protein ExoP